MVDSSNNKYVLIFIEYLDQMNHQEKVIAKLRCTGSNREEQAKDLMIDSTSNVISNNILNNSFVKSILGK